MRLGQHFARCASSTGPQRTLAWLPSSTSTPLGPTMMKLPNCGVMFVTPTNPRFIDKAWTRGGDVYILDIQDSIAPAEKARCRSLIRESIPKANKGGAA